MTEIRQAADVRDVPWESFLYYAGSDDPKFADAWLLNPANVVSHFSNGCYCRLCDSWFKGSPSVHVAAHEPSLRAWRAERAARRNGHSEKGADLGELMAEARRLRDEGRSVAEVANAIGVSRRTAYRYLSA